MKLISVIFLLLAPLLIICEEHRQSVDCSDIPRRVHRRRSGVYSIHPGGGMSAVKVYCDLRSEGGKWTVIQRRVDGSVNFYRGWNQYKLGFGSPSGEYWLGLENIYHLTSERKYELLVDMQDFDGRKVYARYTSFSVGPESDGYRLQVSGFLNGGAGDALTYHNRQRFSTFDRDQDSSGVNCARYHLGAFWYNACHYANPNGVYRWGADGTFFAIGVEWVQWRGHYYSLKSISMKIRPVQ
ncbi:microfibril-associated glycoprotein 4-like isoform X2 [Anabas testudineus]|uniref:Fibrinogen C-terminal domain-containing protein n=1 Tax=Anabas testudineus TaxID=64144 RepID=A0A7N6A023_ANATE|nr:microfibril-associated glycoprotein 4-like isoform X2 [Anabas testudineus]XP_026207147.1 microfibril-associated glycoprotein 4-like isoform X2 [Anabas testudineus]XP_026207148.1 microfibril-associated glycoprotein 4-like isoform X2 [Anabas testudineus]